LRDIDVEEVQEQCAAYLVGYYRARGAKIIGFSAD
jgi:hypothetical protein